MCLYLGVAENLVDLVAYCVCRLMEATIFSFMMMCSTAKAKLSSNNQITMVEQ
ncbi:uncharacterized protein LOC6559474 [Drosophila grimshawi]|uniref:GH22108 n=1 Tax=Drosophila grimshawi TaxID=7222 RepID=B4J460_DROGR|nr:uncharacterized protein LOC6559474 [Drosophila grimshawi]EDW02666.1 GH22108 [Drosophila grimshawi]